MKLKKLSVDWLYVKIVIGIILISILAFHAGRAYEQTDNCEYFIKEHAEVVRECNQKIRECNNIPDEFNLSEVINYNGSG